jgi:hypothetical protein
MRKEFGWDLSTESAIRKIGGLSQDDDLLLLLEKYTAREI